MSNLFYRNPLFLLITIFVIVIWGIVSYYTLPRLEDPVLTQRHALITTRVPGASSEQIESLVSETIEEELFEIEQIETIESISRTNFSSIYVKLKDRVKDTKTIWSEIRDKLSDVQPKLPPTASEPELKDLEIKANSTIFALTWNLEEPVNYAILQRVADELANKIRLIEGTEKVEFFGKPEEEILVEVIPSNLAALGLTIKSLSQEIASSDTKIPTGQLRNFNNELLFELQEEPNSIERIENIPIKNSKSGHFALLKDIAKVKKGIGNPASSIAIIDGRPAITLAALVEPSQRIDTWSKKVRKTLVRFENFNTGGIKVKVIFELSTYVNSVLQNLFINLFLGILFVNLISVLIMGWRAAFIISISLFLSVLMVFGGMKLLNLPLDRSSFTGLIIALGLLVDNVIVMTDEIYHQLQGEQQTTEVIDKSVKKLWIPLFSSTLTTTLAFMPNLFVLGDVGEYISPIAISVIIALVSSLFLAITVVPTIAVKLHPSSSITKNWWNQGVSYPSLTNTYQWVLKKLLRKPVLGLGLSLIFPLIGFAQIFHLDQQFFPPAERDHFQIEVELAAASSLEKTKTNLEQIRQILMSYPQVTNVNWFVGESAPQFYYNVFANRQESSNYGQGLIQLQSLTGLYELVNTLQKKLDEAFPQAQILVRQLEQGTPFPAPIELRIYGSDLEILRNLGDRVRVQLAEVPNITHTRTTLSEFLPQLGLQIDSERANLVGLDKAAIAQQLFGSLEGYLGGSIIEGTEELPIRVRFANLDRRNLDRIASLELLPESSNISTSIPLSAVANIKLIAQPAAIARRNGQRVNVVQGFIRAGILPANVLRNFRERLEKSELKPPLGYTFEYGGEVAERNKAVFQILSKSGFLFIFIAITLILSFRSFYLGGIIACVAVCSGGLGLLSLKIFGYPLGIMSLFGAMALVGVAVNDSIVVLAGLEECSSIGQVNYETVSSVVMRSTRHVLATTVTTMAGFMPLVINGGLLWPPMAIVVVGGVWGSTLLALFFVPCAYINIKGYTTKA